MKWLTVNLCLETSLTGKHLGINQEVIYGDIGCIRVLRTMHKR